MDHDPAHSHPLSNWPGPLAFVLSGGAAYGATQVGMLQALSEVGIVPDMVVGTSVGALNGIRYATEPSTAIDNLTQIWASMKPSRIFGSRTKVGSAISAARNGMRSNSTALCSPEPLQKLLEDNIGDRHLESLPIRSAVVVTDAQIGQPKLLTRGKVCPALLASTALPGVFPPVNLDGCFYVDGGVSANVPIRQAIAFGAKSVVVLDGTPTSMPGTIPTSVLGSVLHASMIAVRNQRADAIEELVGKYPVLQIPRVTPPSQGGFDFDNSAELMEQGYRSTKNFLQQLPELTDTSRRHSAGTEAPKAPSVNRTDTSGRPHSASPPASSPLKL